MSYPYIPIHPIPTDQSVLTWITPCQDTPTQAAAGNSPSITFVSGGVHSVVKGQKTSYVEAAVWQKDVPSIEASIIKAKDSVKFYGLDVDLKKRGVADTEIIEGISKLNIDDLTNRILEGEVTLVF